MGQQRPECVAAAFQRDISQEGYVDPSRPSLAHDRGFPGKPLRSTSPMPRTCSSFSRTCSTTCVVLSMAKQEACSKGFATISIMSGRRLQNVVRAMSESA